MTQAFVEKIDLATTRLSDEKLAQLRQLIPEAFTEGKVDFEALRRSLGDAVETSPKEERFGLRWPGKSQLQQIINQPSVGTLVPQPEESVDWDTTQNLIIEGDNLEVLKLLQKSYAGQVKMIYIDPPYNTGNDFIYPDNFTEGLQTYLEFTGQVDGNGHKVHSNTETTGRYHANWLNMMYPRLYLARNLLREDGVMFISIDDHEVHSLRALMNEVFGEENFVSSFVWHNEGNVDQQSKIKGVHEYLMCFARNQSSFARPQIIDPNIPEDSKLYNEQIENSITKNGPANPPSEVLLPEGFPATFEEGFVEPRTDKYPWVLDRIEVKDGCLAKSARLKSGWSSRNLLDLFIKNGLVPISDSEGRETDFVLTDTGAIYGRKKRAANQGHVLSVIRNVGTTKRSSSQLSKWGLEYSYPKPELLLKYASQIATAADRNAVILDFFAGSGTTAHAVMQQNGEDGGNRRYILVQLPEPLDDPKTLNDGTCLTTVANICRERVRRAGKKIASETETPVDTGFRAYKLAPSNFTPWDGRAPEFMTSARQASFMPETRQLSMADQLRDAADHIRPDAADDALLAELLLRIGLDLTTPVVAEQMGGKTVYDVDHGTVLVCLDRHITLDVIEQMAARTPAEIICLDAGFPNDQTKVNAGQIIASHARDEQISIAFKVV